MILSILESSQYLFAIYIVLHIKILRVKIVKYSNNILIVVDINLLFVLDFVSGWYESEQVGLGGVGCAQHHLTLTNHLLNAQLHMAQCS